MASDQRKSDKDITPYPLHRMVAVLDDEDSIRAALNELAKIGVDNSKITVLRGAEDVERLDPRGDQHGLFGRLLRLLQQTAEESTALQFHQDALNEGKNVIYVPARGETQKDAAAKALRLTGGHHLVYFGRWTMQR